MGRVVKEGEFQRFQRYFRQYQKVFGLTGWMVYFKHEPLDGYFADVTFSCVDMVATVRLSSILEEKDWKQRDIRRSAKHEALHLLLGRIEYEAKVRYTVEGTLYEAVEEVVHKLEGLIP